MSVIRSCLPPVLLLFLEKSRGERTEFCLAGGTVRDILLCRKTKDIDVTVSAHALYWAEKFAGFSNGTFVLLDEKEGVARVVAGDHQVDFTEYRKGSQRLGEDLALRDLTINALGVCLEMDAARDRIPLIDPTSGYDDLQNGIVRFTSEQSLIDDPLRMLRAYRFAATLGFIIEPGSRELVKRHADEIKRCSGERINYELNCLFSALKSYRILRRMAEDGLLLVIAPEIADMRGVDQNGYHNQNVYEHSLRAFDFLEEIAVNPADYFPQKYTKDIKDCLNSNHVSVLLKWAVLFHDVGKPKTAERKGGRTTFYSHDQIGAEIFAGFAERLKWSRKDTGFVSKLILLHMRPFHLINVLRSGQLTPRAVSRLIRDAGDGIIALFILAIADSMAGSGPIKPADCEALLIELFEAVMIFYNERLRLQTLPRLLTGKDLIEIFRLKPGPVFRKILEEIENARIAGQLHAREEAIALVKEMLQKGFDDRA